MPRPRTLLCSLLGALLAAAPIHGSDPGHAVKPGSTPNHLAGEKSLYLRQHAYNPVDWYPWGPEAFARARAMDRPILLSIGYSTCHWCHVMERESFTDPEVARVLNAGFISIKVDREEHPDVDTIYMSALQATGEGGGWPLNMFLTPDLKPFHGGTYFPKDVFLRTLSGLTEAWKKDRPRIGQVTDGLLRALRTYTTQVAQGQLDLSLCGTFVESHAEKFDVAFGGFGPAPKFPPSMTLRVMLRHHAVFGHQASLDMVEKTLDEMARGGMYDQVGGGFHRYSTDRQWLVPHFEKMLYDNALLAVAYIEAWQATGKERYAITAREILDYCLREMRHPEGAFYSATDADSEGEEGRFFVWTPAQVKEVLGAEAAQFCEIHDVTPAGNFEHKLSILHLPRPLEDWATRLKVPLASLRAQVTAQRARLYAAREKRPHPARDEKVITAWSALMTSAMALGAQAFDDARYREAAVAAGNFMFAKLVDGGTVYRRYVDGQRAHPGSLEDHAYLLDACVDLYETTFDPVWLERALALLAVTEAEFRDAKPGGYFLARPRPDLLVQVKQAMDDACPSANAVMVRVKARLAELTGRADLRATAQADADAFAGMVRRYPSAFASMVIALHMLAGDPFEIVFSGDLESREGAALVRAVHTRFLPARVVARAGGPHAARAAGLIPLLEGRDRHGAPPTVHVCRKRVCKLPVTDPAALAGQLKVKPK